MELGKTMKSLLINVVNNKELILKDLERLSLEEVSLGVVIQCYANNGITSSLEDFVKLEQRVETIITMILLTEDDK